MERHPAVSPVAGGSRCSRGGSTISELRMGAMNPGAATFLSPQLGRACGDRNVAAPKGGSWGGNSPPSGVGMAMHGYGRAMGRGVGRSRRPGWPPGRRPRPRCALGKGDQNPKLGFHAGESEFQVCVRHLRTGESGLQVCARHLRAGESRLQVCARHLRAGESGLQVCARHFRPDIGVGYEFQPLFVRCNRKHKSNIRPPIRSTQAPGSGTV